MNKMTNEYQDHFITTFTGHKFHYLSPSLEEIDIRDIAHALSMTCRFGGHCREYYDVASHSIFVSNLVQQKHKLSALLHDAHEAYLHDVPRPIKRDMPQYKIMADNIQRVINEKYGLEMNEEIKHADEVMLATEARDLGLDMTDWAELPPPLPQELRVVKHGIAEIAFLYTFRDLTEGQLVKT